MPSQGLLQHFICSSCGESFLLASHVTVSLGEHICPTCSDLIKSEELVMSTKDEMEKVLEQDLQKDLEEKANIDLVDDVESMLNDEEEDDVSYDKYVEGILDEDEKAAADDAEYDEDDEDDEDFDEDDEDFDEDENED